MNCPKCGCPLDPGEKCVCETITVPPLRLRLAASSESLCRDALEEIERLDAREARVRAVIDEYEKGVALGPQYTLLRMVIVTKELRAALEGK
jgi:hypothetical protein